MNEIDAEVESLARDWQAADRGDRALRRRFHARLDQLRTRWRREAARFSPSAVTRLKLVAEELRRPHRRAEPREVLRALFAYESFRPGQAEIIEAVLEGRDCVGVMPTGAGKSLTYQIPARVLGGTVLVVSPLIALMKDQVDALEELGVPATFLNSSLTPEERRERVQRVRAGEIEIVYAAPEGLEASVGAALDGVDLSLIAVDEAHCISHWGHDFRPAYRNLSGLKRRFGSIPVLALTATATREVVADIIRQLGMVAPAEFRGSFFRRNLRLAVVKKGDGVRVRDAILRLCRARAGQSGIVYCLSRKAAESTAEFLREKGVRAAAYHAGLESQTRARVQDQFRRDEVDVVCATVAFGMGIDKPDIRYVIHRDLPRSIEAYYQEVGRAGRDGLPSDCVLFYSFADVAALETILDGDSETTDEMRARHKGKVREMLALAERRGCRHRSLVSYLGESIDACGDVCDVCGNFDLLAEAKPARTVEVEGDPGLFGELRALRRRLADARGLPAFLVFSDAVLLRLAAARPRTALEMLAVPGIGPKKMALYGDAFLALLRA